MDQTQKEQQDLATQAPNISESSPVYVKDNKNGFKIFAVVSFIIVFCIFGYLFYKSDVVNFFGFSKNKSIVDSSQTSQVDQNDKKIESKKQDESVEWSLISQPFKPRFKLFDTDDGSENPAFFWIAYPGVSYFINEQGDVVYGSVNSDPDSNKIISADKNTFSLLVHWLPDGIDGIEFGKDKESVFYRGYKIDGADPATFEVLKYGNALTNYSKDKNHVYLENNLITGADPATFTIIKCISIDRADYCWKYVAKDKTYAYVGGDVWPVPDVASLNSGDGCSPLQDKNYFYRAKIFGEPPIALELPSPASFKRIGDSCYYRNNNDIYFSPANKIIGADADTFEVLSSEPYYARDKNRFYSGAEVTDSKFIMDLFK